MSCAIVHFYSATCGNSDVLMKFAKWDFYFMCQLFYEETLESILGMYWSTVKGLIARKVFWLCNSVQCLPFVIV